MSDERVRVRVRLVGGRLAYGVLTTAHAASSCGRPVIVPDDGDVADVWPAAEIEIAPDAPDQGEPDRDENGGAAQKAAGN